ncbi:MAG: hypothetical protein M3450_05110 [Actinomycetota bacterium]|nr:hypothetical protein [Actinomycetota bacterium]
MTPISTIRIDAVVHQLDDAVAAACTEGDGRFSPLLDVIDPVGGADDDEVLNFSIRVAHDEAWGQARIDALGHVVLESP